MSLQKIKSLEGKDEYVLLPIDIYRALKNEIDEQFAKPRKRTRSEDSFVPFALEDYVDNPVALARIKSRLKQEELAEQMRVSQAYISKIENQAKVTAKLMDRVHEAIKRAKRVK
jgi:ribosome-binding protein aMBF1 (putative translation factor)